MSGSSVCFYLYTPLLFISLLVANLTSLAVSQKQCMVCFFNQWKGIGSLGVKKTLLFLRDQPPAPLFFPTFFFFFFNRAVPGLLGSRMHFKKKFSDPVEHGQRHTATKRELATGRKAMAKLARKMSGWFLRRTKALISDQLPKKEDRVRAPVHFKYNANEYFSSLLVFSLLSCLY